MGFNGPGARGAHDLVFISTYLMCLSMSTQMRRNSIALYCKRKKNFKDLCGIASLDIEILTSCLKC